jgi:hypothetical protein
MTKFTDGFIPSNHELIEDLLIPSEATVNASAAPIIVVTSKGAPRTVLPLWKGERFCVTEDLLFRNIYKITHIRTGISLNNAFGWTGRTFGYCVELARKIDQSEILKEMDKIPPPIESLAAFQDFLDHYSEALERWRKELISIDSALTKSYSQSAVEE